MLLRMYIDVLSWWVGTTSDVLSWWMCTVYYAIYDALKCSVKVYLHCATSDLLSYWVCTTGL